MLFFLSRASISAKLAASSLAFALPIAVLTLFLVRGLDKDIDFAKQEMLGNAALRPMVRLLVHLPDGASGRSQAQADFSALAEVTARAAEPLEFTPAGLARRGRESLAPAAVESRWRRLGDNPSAADQDALVADVRGMISHAGDTSNLILDPDLDSYYLMDVVLLALPQTLDRTASAVRGALAFARAAEPSQAGHNALAVNAAMLREADLERVRASLDTALKEDPLFYGRSASLHSAVPPKAQAYYQAAGALVSLLERIAAGDKPSEAEIAAAGNRARQAELELWETVSAELDKLLATRIEHYQGRMVWALGLSMAALAVAGFVVFLIARGILAQLGGIREYARKVAAGDLKAAPCARCRGELKELSDDIQAMVGDLRDRLGYTLSLQNAFKVPLLVADVDAKVTYTNQELLNFIEVEGRPEDWIGLTVAQLVRNDAQQDTVMSKCLRENRCVYKAEITFITRRNNIRHALVDSELLTDLDGNITGVVGVLSDVTDMKRHESELERRNNALALAAGSSQEITVSLGEAVRRLAGCIAQAADGATHQNERASDTVEAMTAMNASAQQVADLAGEAALSADEAKGTASEGADMVRTAVDSIAAVRAQVLELQDKMRELGSQADNVGKVLQVIGDIADQTNLLALNAAIEAARAGDAGRGFAVVADEVRKLAEKTMQATHEVGSTLDAIRGGAAQTLKATEQAAREIVESTRLAESSGEYLGRIVSIVQGSSEQAKAIALAAGDQARASAQVNQAVAEIEGVSSRTAQGMEEASRALEEVSRQAQSLEELIRGMKD